MAKHDALYSYLESRKEDRFFMTFAEMEKILGFPHCDSAYTYPQYWHCGGGHTLPGTILWKTGLEIKPDIENKRVEFVRVFKF